MQENMMRENARRSSLEVIWLFGSVDVKSSLAGSRVARWVPFLLVEWVAYYFRCIHIRTSPNILPFLSRGW